MADPKLNQLLQKSAQAVEESRQLIDHIKRKKDRDEITVAKSIFDEIVEFSEHEETPKEARGRKGGQARAEKLTPAKRKAIAKKAADSRWNRTT